MLLSQQDAFEVAIAVVIWVFLGCLNAAFAAGCFRRADGWVGVTDEDFRSQCRFRSRMLSKLKLKYMKIIVNVSMPLSQQDAFEAGCI